MADPAWAFKAFSDKGLKKSPQKHYNCMPISEIAALPVADLANPRACALVMWTTGPFLKQSIGVLEAWGFTYKTAGSWGKESRTGRKIHFGPGHILRGASEFFLVGTMGKPKVNTHSVRSLILSEEDFEDQQLMIALQTLGVDLDELYSLLLPNFIRAPVREHSRKPEQMRLNVEALWDGPYLELFAREQAPNWAFWGDQTDKFSTRQAPEEALPLLISAA